MRRPTGAGTIEKYGTRYRARLPDAKRTPLGVYDTPEKAAEALDAYFAVASAPAGETLATYGPRWLERRRRSRPKSYDQDAARWKLYVEAWDCFKWPLREIRRGDVKRFVEGLQRKDLADQTCRNALNLLRVCLRAALDDEILQTNPSDGVRIDAKGNVDDVWGYLRPEEQGKLLLLKKMPDHLRALAGFAIGTGLRWGEQRTLQLVDVHVEGKKPHVYVRRSVKGSTKNQRHRRVPLFGLGLAAARALVTLAEKRRNPRGLLCLPPRGEAYVGKNGPSLARWLELAEIERHIRWHDLRHTAASSLVAGWWGHKWKLIEVRDFMGHRSITTTERYAHLAGTVVEDAAEQTSRRHDGATGDLANYLSRLGDLDPRPTVYETAQKRRRARQLGGPNGAAVAPKGRGMRKRMLQLVSVAKSGDRNAETRVLAGLRKVARMLPQMTVARGAR